MHKAWDEVAGNWATIKVITRRVWTPIEVDLTAVETLEKKEKIVLCSVSFLT
jgi:hypothetical protein